MPKFIIKWDVGYGQSVDVIECESIEQARECAYDAAREEFENSVSYVAVPFTQSEWEAQRLPGQEVGE